MKFKHLILFISFLTFFTAKAQVLPIDSTTRKITFQETIALDSLSKDTLFARSLEWMTHYYKTSKFDVNDKISKIGIESYFIVSLTYDFKYKSEHNVTYEILINVRDGKYKYSLTNFTIYAVKTGPKSSQPLEAAFAKMTTPNKKEFYAQFNNQTKLLTDDLKTSISTGKIKKVDEWK